MHNARKRHTHTVIKYYVWAALRHWQSQKYMYIHVGMYVIKYVVFRCALTLSKNVVSLSLWPVAINANRSA